MIFGIGTDIVEVSRIEDSLARFGHAFAMRLLNEREMQEFMLTNTQARFLAKRFAAKEAFAKALGTGIRTPARPYREHMLSARSHPPGCARARSRREHVISRTKAD